MSKAIDVKMHYPHSDKYEYETYLEILNLDEERIKDVTTGNGFIVSAPKAIKDDLKDENGIFSPKYGQTLQDVNPYGDRYRCKCGNLKTRFYNGQTCPLCGTKVTYVDDNFEFFGYITLSENYHLIILICISILQVLLVVQYLTILLLQMTRLMKMVILWSLKGLKMNHLKILA